MKNQNNNDPETRSFLLTFDQSSVVWSNNLKKMNPGVSIKVVLSNNTNHSTATGCFTCKTLRIWFRIVHMMIEWNRRCTFSCSIYKEVMYRQMNSRLQRQSTIREFNTCLEQSGFKKKIPLFAHNVEHGLIIIMLCAAGCLVVHLSMHNVTSFCFYSKAKGYDI